MTLDVYRQFLIPLPLVSALSSNANGSYGQVKYVS
jgi:hypothetical protein